MNIYKLPLIVAVVGLAVLSAQEKDIILRRPPTVFDTNFPPITNVVILRGLTNCITDFISIEEYIKYAGVTNIVKHLVTNGAVCAIVGHQWHPYQGALLIHPVYPPEPIPVYRVCALCKRTEQQFIEWRGVQP